jgi:hypothetical protein
MERVPGAPGLAVFETWVSPRLCVFIRHIFENGWAFILGACQSYSLSSREIRSLHHAWTAYALALLSLGCIVFWIWKLANLGIVRRPDSLDTSQSG